MESVTTQDNSQESQVSQATTEPVVENTAPVEAAATEGAETPAPPPYQPNYKFSVLKKEHEFPEQVRPNIKTPEDEKFYRDVFEKAYGIDHVKSERDKYRTEYQTIQQKTEPVMQLAQKLGHFYQAGDMDAYFKTLGLNDEQIMKYALKKAELAQLPIEQRAVYDQQRAAQDRAYQLEQQLQQERAQREQMVNERLAHDLETTLSRPEVVSFAQSFDQRHGEGSFQQEIINRGQLYWQAQGRVVSPEQIASELMRFAPSQTSSQPQTQTMPNQTTGKKDLPVIPNTGSGSASPAQRSIRSLDDLKKIAAEKFA